MEQLVVPLNVELHANQEVINASRARNIVVKSGKRFGKSKLAAYKICKWAGEKRGLYFYCSPTYRQSKSIAWAELLEVLPHKIIKRKLENELELTLINDSIIRLVGTDNQDSLRGIGLKGVVFDEAAYVDPYVWNNIIRGQLLAVKGEPPGPAFFISSPNKTGRNWYSQFFEDAQRKKALGDPDWDAFFFTIYDNPLLSREEIDKIKDDSTDDEWQTEYMANESAHAGQIYSEFSFDKHVRSEGLGSISHLVRGIDWGIAHPTVCLFVQVDEAGKRLHVEDEFVRSDLTVEESCRVIQQKTGQRPVDWTVIDPSMFKRDKFQKQKLEADEFLRCGIPVIPANNQERGYNITKMFFKKDMISISPKCKNLIRGVKTLQWGDTEGDDETDVLRYVCVKLHDTVFRGVFKQAEEKQVSPFQARAYSFRDRLLFPERKDEVSTVRAEIERY